MRIRLWLLALVCLACGIASRLAFAAYAPPDSRADAWLIWSHEALWYTAALLLALPHVGRRGRVGRLPREVSGGGAAVVWSVALVLAYMVIIWSSMPDD